MTNTTQNNWETEFTTLLDDLSRVQAELLDVLNQKRERLAKIDDAHLEELQPKEELLVANLQACQQRRQQLLDRAAEQGVAASNLRTLARTFAPPKRKSVEPRMTQVQSQARLLQHQALTNWVIAQKTLIHLSQLLEIIATGGRLQPTYGMIGEIPSASGSILNEVG